MPGTVKTANGLVHLMSPIGGGKHTLCGIAYDAAGSHSEEGWRMLPGVAPSTVSCRGCAAVILACRGVRVQSDDWLVEPDVR